MNESGSWLHNSASKLTGHRHIAGKLVAGVGIVALVLMGYAYGPATADKKAAPDSAESPKASAAIVLAQAPDAEVQKLIPLPEPANVPPPSAADFDRAAPAPTEQDIQALIPVPVPADLPPLTAADFAEESQTATAAEPAAEPKQDATAATPAPASPTEEPKQEAETPTSVEPVQETAAAEPASEPQLSAEEIKKLTGKDLVQAPIAESLADADRSIAENLRNLLAGSASRYLDRREERQAAEAFYRDRGFAPVWIDKGARAPRADAAIRVLHAADTEGLEPADYPVPNFSGDARALAEAELRLTGSVLDYVRHASVGRVHYSRVSSEIEYKLVAPDSAGVLAKLSDTADIGMALAAYQPQHPQYKALKVKLAEVRKAAGEKKVVRIPAGPTLKPGMEDSRVALLRKRLEISGDPDNWTYDETVAEAVVTFQKNAGLTADGLAGPATLRALNGPSRANRIDTIIVNLDRWRWIPRDLGSAHSILNIPDFTIQVVRDGAKIWQTKTVVGRQSRQTPLISDEMKFITVNPTWNVPPGIMANDYLPALQDDPTALERIGVRVEQNRDGTIRMYQPPGDNNALGRLRFNFPNKFLVYQHDTPDKHLFQRDVRAYSSGCMRVQDPLKYAEILLSIALPNEGYSRERIRAMYGPSERNINFPKPFPVHITYQTAFVDDAGNLQIRDDIYGHDAEMIAVLKGSDRRVADIAIPRRHVQVSREELRLPNGVYLGAYDGGGYNRGYGRNPVEDFFRSIFR